MISPKPAWTPRTAPARSTRVLANVLHPRTLALVACVVIAGWLVFVPLAALFYTAFTEDTGFGPGPASLRNFIDAYSSWHVLRLFGNSLVFAIGTAVATLLMGTLVAFVVERTDAPLGPLFHSLALLSFAIPGLLTSMAWIFVLSPNIGWVNALFKSWFGLTEAPLSIYSMGGMIWALSSHYFPLAYLMLGPTLARARRPLEEAALVSGREILAGAAASITLPLLRPAILSTLVLLFMLGMSSYEVPRLIGRPARIDVFTTEIQAAVQNAPPEFGTASALGMTLLVHLRHRRVPGPAGDAQRRGLRDHHRQGLHADPHQAAQMALAGGARRAGAVLRGARSAAADAGVAVVLPQSGAAVHRLDFAVHLGELRVHPDTIRSSSTR